ncbi:MAG: 4Fe-4S dicluster domain-containing protein [Armatimonadetes bacterium]|nr:4Fe-4S dicluster domain-containing protein [Armatimonadota bacterium]MDW8122322.1 4Fe-4S dicluster domain-containing protein [Armatimonadota bacterium]
MSVAIQREVEQVDVFIMGKRYQVPKGLTILKALEYAGYRLVRGVGCRAGFCGACATVYRKEGDFRLRVGLACQTVIEDRMYLTQIPFYPAVKKTYDIEQLRPDADTILRLYPEVTRCLQCNTCRKVCPQDLDVMRYIAAAARGDIAKAADLSFDCLQCGLCTSRCPAEISHYNVATLARRLYGRHLAPPAPHLTARIRELTEGQFDKEVAQMRALSPDQLQTLYAERDIEPEELVPVSKKDED